MFHHGKLRNKIFFVIAFVSIVPLLFAGAISYFSLTASHRVDVANLEDTLLDQKLGEVSSTWNNMTTNLRPAIISKNADALTGGAQAPFMSQIFELGQSNGLKELTLIDLTGKEIAKDTEDAPSGVVTSTLANDTGASWLADAAAGKTVSGDVFFTEGEPMISIVTPVLANGLVIDLLRGVFQLSGIQTAIRSVALGEKGYLYLVDAKGEVMVSNINGPAATADVSGIGIVKSVLGGHDFAGPDGQARYKNFIGDAVVAAGKSVSPFGWALIAEWPVEEADAGVNNILNNNLYVLCAAIIAVIMVSIVLAAFIVRPVRKLEDSTSLVSAGKFDTAVDIKTGDELEDLGDAFNKMTAGLKRLEELKNEFVFVAAHELRTPVAAMKGYLTLILEGITGPITDKTKDFMEKVVQSNDRLAQLVNDLLEVSRSEGGKLTIKVAPVSIIAPIQSVLAELHPLAEKATVTMHYAPSDGLPQIMADSGRLREVMVNLVGNAIKYMGPVKEGGLVRSITVSHEVKGRELLTHIADTGLGISKEAQAKLFEKFYRVSTDKTRDIQGTGLGLFIVKEIIEKMNGTISVVSEGEGKGTTFSFTLPLA